MGQIFSRQRRPPQIQDERGDQGTPTAEECQECGPSSSGHQVVSEEEQPAMINNTLNNTITPLPVADSNPPFNSMETNTDINQVFPGHAPEHLIHEVPANSGNQPSALVAGPSAGQTGFALLYPHASGPQPIPPATHDQPPPPGLQPPAEGPQPPAEGLQPPAEELPPEPWDQQHESGSYNSADSNDSADSFTGNSNSSGGSSTTNDNNPCRSNGTTSTQYDNDSQQNGQNSEAKKTALQPGDPLEELWDNPYFKKDICEPLDYIHCATNILDHRHLMKECNIPAEESAAIISCTRYSPSEKLLSVIRSKYPTFEMQDLCDTLEKGRANRTRRLLKAALKAGKFAETDYVTDVLDKNLDLATSIITQLDSTGRWRQVSDKLGIPKEQWSLFDRDPASGNPAETFFQILWTQSPKLKIKMLKNLLGELEEHNLMLKMSHISDDKYVSDLRSKPTLMHDDILPILNDPSSTRLMKLAEKFQAKGYLKDINIQIFKTCESSSYESPTEKMMDYIVTSDEKEYTIQDFVDKLMKIRRIDCCDIVSKYVGGLRYEDIGDDSESSANGQNAHHHTQESRQ